MAGGNEGGALDLSAYRRWTSDVTIFAAIDKPIASCHGIQLDYRVAL